MQFAVLGPIEVTSDAGHALPLGGPKQRTVLAMLLLEANRPVSKDRLIDGVWGERAPPSAGETLDTYVSRLRRLLGPDRLARRPAVMSCGSAGELDLSTFEELVASAQQLRP